MGDIVIRHSAKPKLLEVNRRTYLSTLECRLYVNNVTPNPATGNGQFVESVDAAHVPQIPAFGPATLTDDNCGLLSAPSLDYTCAHDAGDYVVYGFYYTDPLDADEWVYAERGDTPIPIIASGQHVLVLPRWHNEEGACPGM